MVCGCARGSMPNAESTRVWTNAFAPPPELRDLGTPFWLAVTLLEYAEWLSRNGRAEDAAALIPEGRAIFEDLRAARWLARLDALERGEGTYATASAGGET